MKPLRQNTFLHIPSNKAKPKFLSQETLDGQEPLKKRLLFLLLFITIVDLIITTILPPSSDQPPSPLHPALLFVQPAVVVLLIGACYLPYLRKPSRHLKIKVLLNCVASIIYGIYIVLVEVACIEDALATNSQGSWIRAHTTLSYSIFIFLLFTFFTPIWYLKAFIGACYYMGIMIAYIRAQHPAMAWMIVRNLVNSVYILILIGLGSKFRWDLYLKSLESEAWNQVQSNIIERNPSSIAVIDGNNHIIYSNEEFKKLTDSNTVGFFRRVESLKMRRNVETSANNIDNLATLYEYKQTLGDDSDLESPSFKRRGNPLLRRHENLSELINYYKTLMDNDDLYDGDQFVFDGKAQRMPNKDMFLSYEITIIPLPEYQKILLMLNNTTMRDLLVSLENTSEYKDKLLASVSHELRTPLNGNLGFLQAALGDHSIPELTKEKLLIPAFRSGKLLLHLINDILDYSQLQRKRIYLQCEARSLGEILKYCHDLLEHTFEAKGIKLSLVVGNEVPALFSTDHDRLTQVTLNLLSNALKFTMRGEVTIEADLVESNVVEIKVKDTGIGIQEEDIQKLFQDKTLKTFESTERQQHSKGVGLGLQISNKIAKRLGDTREGLRVQSVPGEGSVFSFRVANRPSNTMSPFGTTNEAVIASAAQRLDLINLDTSQEHSSLPNIPCELDGRKRSVNQSPSYKTKSTKGHLRNARSYEMNSIAIEAPSSKNKRILVVDDEPFNILAIRYLLADIVVQVDSANNGQEALEKITHQALSFEPYCLVLMDCQMPVMDGFETTVTLVRKMKGKELPLTPIVGCTAFSAKEKLERCIKSGMREVVTKPIMKEKLIEVMKRYLEL